MWFQARDKCLGRQVLFRQRFPCFGHGLLPLSPVFEDPQIHEKGRRGALSPGSAVVAPKDRVGAWASVETTGVPVGIRPHPHAEPARRTGPRL